MDDVNRTDANPGRVICSPLLCDYQSVTRFALLSLLLSLPACSDDGQDTLDPSTTSGPGSSTGNGSTGEGTTHEGSSSTSGGTEAYGSGETGEALTTGGGTSSTSEPIEVTTDSTGIVTTTGDETGEGMTGGEIVCWVQRCDDGSACDPGLSCVQHPNGVEANLWVCANPCAEQDGEVQCVLEAFMCDVPVKGECTKVDGVVMCLPSLCDGPVDCAFDQQCVDGFCL